MDRIDKHRELIITLAAFQIRGNGLTEAWIMFHRQAGFPEWEMAGLAKSLDPESEVTPQVAFQNFGGWDTRPVIPGLKRLAFFVERIVAHFDEECFSGACQAP